MSTLHPSLHRPFLPTTKPGRISVTLAIIFVVVLVAQTIMTEIVGDETQLAFLLFLAAMTGIAGGIMALVLLIRRIDRSISVFLVAAIAALPVLFILVEALFPHE
jgi:energy-converting hydrogenase Eha subunit A